MPRMHMLGSVTDTINTSFVIESARGLIVIDGGFKTEAENLYKHIRSLGKSVIAWFLTHPHSDHTDALRELLRCYSNEIKPQKLYFNFPPAEFIDKYAPDSAENGVWLNKLLSDLAKFEIPTITVCKDDVFDFGDLKITVLREPCHEITEDFHNNSSIVLKLETNNTDVIFLGDLGVEGGRHLLRTVSADRLKSHYCQMAHHGQDAVEKDVYDVIKPECCLWCTPTWLWDNIGDGGYNTGIYQTVIVRGWMDELGVKEHYVMKDGPFIIEL